MTAPEPVYDAVAAANIQGNIIPGFTKDHQYFLFLRFDDRAGARRFTTWLAPRVTSMAEALDFRARRRTEHVAGQSAVWTAVAFSYKGIATLAGSESADAFGEHSFRQGLSARSAYLGDPTASERLGSQVNWSVGGPGNEAHALIVVAIRSSVSATRTATEPGH
ncbi:hypothetical protein OG921_05030 [Aldersonia sp. NBC_00410]|uniref:hypothetical protein n=1 Tax=Aldersonia sp. NBC_00410 TaxID=2975954 RepID=UPI0022506C44|nr:hypothetical protein [Aldersonia sp. NBC_00410]MCX5042532.1 hypothetical protein [Aldersonia sp. NBC_00410]